ncbi:MAG: hypothetical protein Q9191_006600 [Dirinaria sp. TL-2023a]
MGELPRSLRESVDSSKAEYRQLGKSGLRVSVPILGAMSFGNSGWMDWLLSEDKALPILKAAYDRGLNTWDTANVYSNGESERIIGKAIREYNIPRQKVVILSKCWGCVAEEPGIRTSLADIGRQLPYSKDYVNQFAILTAVEASLARLQTTYLDLLQIHRFDASVPIEETMQTLHDLVRSGKVRYIGASSMWTYQFAMMQFCAKKHGWTKFISMQNHYSLLYREEEREMNRYCSESGVGLIPWAPLARGHLARPRSSFGSTNRSAGEKSAPLNPAMVYPPPITEVDTVIIGHVEEIARKRGWTMSQVALAWINSKVTSPIIGFSSVDRIEEALASRGKVLDEEEIKLLQEPYVTRPVSGHL